MALRIDKLRFRNVLVRGEVPEAPAIEFADALDETFREELDGVVTQDHFDSAMRQLLAEIKSDAAEREARISRNQLVMVGVILGGIALAVAILLGLLL